MHCKFHSLLVELAPTLAARALEAKQEADAASDGEVAAFRSGRSLAYYEVMSTLLQVMEVSGVSFGELGVEPIDPDTDLLRRPKEA